MANDDLARTYAQAIYEKAVERWKKQLASVRETLDREPDLLPRLDNQAEPFDRKKELVNRLFPPNADPEVRNFVSLLVSKGELHLLGQVISEFERIAARGPAREAVRVTSAIELNAAERQQLETRLRAQYGGGIEFEYRVDPEILGGVVVRVGDRVIDGSVASKLAAMRQKLGTAR